MRQRHPTLDGEALQDAILAAARCRANRMHRMEIIPGNPEHRPAFGTLITYRCELCGTVRLDVVARHTGQVLTRSYDTPDWYRASGAEGQDPSWWRTTYWDTLDQSLFLDAEQPRKRGTTR